MKAKALRLVQDFRQALGTSGLAALALLALTALFLGAVVRPMEARQAELAAELARHSAKAGGPSGEAAATKLDTFYRYLDRGEPATDWLARLYGIAKATGIEMSSATYKTRPAGARMTRYEIVLPVEASYLQLREFLTRALAEIPLLSLDQMSLKREARGQGDVQAELHLTLHLVKP